MPKKFIYFFSTFLIVFAIGCSTEKDKRLNRFYHNTTAYYNGYFNAREIVKVSKKQYVKNTPEDYSVLIPVNRYPNEEESKSFFPEMNRAIDKTSTVITKHAMPNEKRGKNAKKEYGKWIDDNWLIMGISYFYKREYEAAIEKFEYIVKMYPKDKNKYYAKLWLAKIYIEMEDFPKALSYINEIEVEKQAKAIKDGKKKKKNKKYTKRKKKKRRKKSKVKVSKKREEAKEERSEIVKFPKKMSADYYATIADYYLRKGEYAKSISQLDSAIQYEKKKKVRVRYKFIQAQLNQELGNNAVASELYTYVIKKSSVYQMDFYSRINRALIASNKNRGSLKKELNKLAKDEKYAEFRDQIYYALGELELQEFNRDEGIRYLEQSSGFPPSNETQKGKTFLRLADIYFENKEYVPAQKYYDSTLSELSREDLKYLPIQEKNESLTRLVSYINTIAVQDSLIKIGILPEKQRRDKAEDIIYKEKLRKEEEIRQLANKRNEDTGPIITANNADKGNFWIYNEQTKEKGRKTFLSIWGKAKLEDDWRRSDKGQSSVAEIVEASEGPTVKDDEVDAFLKDVPVTEEEISKAKMSIINANYLSGLIYVNVLKNTKEAIKSFKDNKKRYHPNAKITPSLYQLYLLYQDLGQSGDVGSVKNFILENYPDSEEAKYILDPNYASKLKNGKQKFQKSYEKAYELWEVDKNTELIAHVDDVLKDADPNPYECQLRYLKAKSYSNLGDMEGLEKSLAVILEKCQNTEIGKIAESNLAKLRNEKIKEEDEDKSKFVFEPNTKHFFIVVVPSNKNFNKVKIELSNLNSNSFSSKNLKTTSIGLDKISQTVIVKEFKNRDEAQSYFIAYKVNPKMKDFITQYKYFTITAKNYSTLFISKDIKKYEEFYNINYF